MWDLPAVQLPGALKVRLTTIYSLHMTHWLIISPNVLASHHLVIRILAPRGLYQVVLPLTLPTTLLSEPENKMATPWQHRDYYLRLYRHVAPASLRL